MLKPDWFDRDFFFLQNIDDVRFEKNRERHFRKDGSATVCLDPDPGVGSFPAVTGVFQVGSHRVCLVHPRCGFR